MTPVELAALQFGYLCGADLIDWASPQMLISQYNVNNNALQKGCNTAQAEINSLLVTKFDLTVEFEKLANAEPDTRNLIILKIASIFAVRNIYGSMQHISEKTLADFQMVDKMVSDLRKAQGNLNDGKENQPSANYRTNLSPSQLTHDRFSTLG